jgi:hypothetical protein
MTKPKKKPTPTPRTATDDALTKLDQAQAAISEADALIADAIALLNNGEIVPPEPEPGDVIEVGLEEDLKSVIDEAPDGATLRLSPDYEYALGVYTLKKSLTIETAGELSEGRVDLDLAAPALTGVSLTITAPNCTLRGLFLEGDGATLITAGPGTTLDRCLLLGREGKQQHRGVAANAPDITITGCHIGGIYKDVDTQAVWCYQKTNHLRITDCFLEASGENFMAGGDDAKSEADMPRDIVIEDCTISKPLEWMETDGCVVKNLLELKCCVGFQMRRCVLENCWAHGQGGFAIVLSVRNQYGKATWTTVSDVVIEDCTIRHVGAGLSVLGRDYTHPSEVMSHVVFRRITIEDLSKAWARGSSVAVGRALQISGGPHDLVYEDINAAIDPGNINAAIFFDQPQYLVEGLVIRRCTLHEGSYGIIGCIPDAPAGVAQMEGHAPGYVWEACTIQQGNSGRKIQYPPDTTILPPVAQRSVEDAGQPTVDG